MCGLVGFHDNITNNDEFSNILLKLSSSIKHRGPNSSGQFIDYNNKIGLSHRRLSILDLSINGNQPMSTSNEDKVLIYNGEIYNHFNIREELNREYSILWKGTSDTETLLNALINWGLNKTLNKINGMFAFAYYNKKHKTIILARDRFGEKPIYYGFIGEGKNKIFIFASEIKSIKKHYKFKNEISDFSTRLFFKYGNIPAPHSVYKNIYKLSPASCLTYNIETKNFNIENYWSIDKTIQQSKNNSFTGSFKEAKDQLEHRLCKSIKNQMLSDVPIGAFLSSGIDSATIAAIMQNQSNTPINTFTIGFNEKLFDESNNAKLISKHLKTNHNEVLLNSSDVISNVPEISKIFDEPFADSSQIPTYLISKLASNDVKVCLTGDAGDELFGGYNRHMIAFKYWTLIQKLPNNFKLILSKLLNSVNSNYLNIFLNKLLRLDIQNLKNKLNKFSKCIKAKSISQFYDFLISDFNDEPEFEDLSINNNTKVNYNLFNNISETENIMFNDTINYLPNDILTKVDRSAMSVSLETRIPFLDIDVFKFAWQLPLQYKINKNYNKYILREVLKRYLPQDLINHKKMGFSLPVGEWLKSELREWVDSLLTKNNIEEIGIFKPERIISIYNEHLSGKKDMQNKLWNILSYISWKHNIINEK